MSSHSGSGPSGRSPFPATRNPRSRSNNSASGLGLGASVLSSSLGGESSSSRGSNPGGMGYQYGTSMMLSGFASTTTPRGEDLEIDASHSSQNPILQQPSPAFHEMLRFSPNNYGNSASVSNSWSPLHRGSSVTNAGRNTKHRFFEGNTTSRFNANVSRTSEIDQSSVIEEVREESVNNNSIENESNDNLVVDGVPINELRSLSQQALLQSPETAVFYANILYAKTGDLTDALLLAKAQYAAEQYTSCLHILDETNVLQQEHPWDAVLVACLALKARKNWVALAELLEDMCRIPDPTINPNNQGYNVGVPTFRSLYVSSSTLEDDDNVGWFQLKQFVDTSMNKKNSKDNSDDAIISFKIHPVAQICYYRGLAYYEMSCMMRAISYWKRSIQMDCQCQIAWEALLKRNLLSPGEAHDWITNELTFQPHQEWLRALYLARIELTPQEIGLSTTTTNATLEEKSNVVSSIHERHHVAMNGSSLLDASSIHITSPLPSFLSPGGFAKGMVDDDEHHQELHPDTETQKMGKKAPIQDEINNAFDNLLNKHKLQDAPQVLALAARRSYRRYEWKAALGYCEELAQLDPTVSEAAFCYISTLVALGHKRTLFRIAHEWVDASPKSAQAWFAVGAYYYCIKRYHVAQRHFCRATRLDPHCMEAWIAFGCSFAACDESDQALASYRAAQRLSPGEHTSLLYMGMEYVRTNHLVLAGHFLESALASSGGDPLCLHELGVISAYKNDHKSAIQWFSRALSAVAGSTEGVNITPSSPLATIIELIQDVYWEPTIFNLGHSYRKTRQFEEAALCYLRCIGLCPGKYSTYAALAFTKQLDGDLDSAISYFHQALSTKADDSFSTEMLNRALKEQTMTRRQRIFDMTAPKAPPPLTEATNLAAKDVSKRDHHVSFSSSMLLSPNLSNMQSSRLKDDKNSFMSEDMDCDLDMSAAS